jgi:hypothetical protein
MQRGLRTGVVIICALVLVLPAAAGRADVPRLTAIVGTNDGFNITLNDAVGKKVTQLAPGTYTVVVQDRSTIHNFHLASNEDPTVDVRTDLEFVGEQSFTVTFRGTEAERRRQARWRDRAQQPGRARRGATGSRWSTAGSGTTSTCGARR